MVVIYALLNYLLIILGLALLDPDRKRQKGSLILAGWGIMFALCLYGLTLGVSAEIFLGLFGLIIFSALMIMLKCIELNKLIPSRPPVNA